MIGFTVRRGRPGGGTLRYEPEPFQEAIHASTARYNALLGSPGLGKTILGAQEIVRFIRGGVGNGLILMPTYGMAYQVALRELRKWIPPGIRIPRSHQNTVIELANGRAIFIRSAEHPDTIDGLTDVTFAWIDEGDLMDADVFDRVRERLNRQSSHGSPGRRVVVTATPQLVGGKSWLRDLFWKPFQDGDPNIFCRKATVWESTRVDAEMKERIDRENPPGTWTRARYDAEWVPIIEGLVYPELPRMTDPPWPFAESDEVILGVDCGYADPFVCVFLGRKGNRWCAFAEVRARGENEGQLARRILSVLRVLDPAGRFPWGITPQPHPFHAPAAARIAFYHDHDPNQVRNVARALHGLGVEFRYVPAAKQRKVESIGFVRDMMIRGLLAFSPAASDTWHEFAGYAWELRGRTEDTTHDTSHGPDAVRYALWTHHQPRSGRLVR